MCDAYRYTDAYAHAHGDAHTDLDALPHADAGVSRHDWM